MNGPAKGKRKTTGARAPSAAGRLSCAGDLQRQVDELAEMLEQSRAALEAEVAKRDRIGAALRAEKDLNEATLATAAALIIVRDAEGRIEHFNRACEVVSGSAAAEVHGSADEGSWLNAEDTARVTAALADVRAGRHPVQYESRWRHRDGGERTIIWSMTGLYGPSGALEHIVNVGIDVTEQRLAEALAQERRQELLHLYRVHTAGSLAASLAHELNQPLAALVAYCETTLAMLRAGESGTERLAVNLEHAVAQAHRASNIIRELRSFLTKNAVRRAPVAIESVLHMVQKLVEPEAHACGVRLELDVAADLPPVMAGRVHLEQLLVNLAQNAIQSIAGAGMKTGTVTISARADSREMARVTVADTGPGLTEEALQRMFEPFYSTKPEGLGMGLAIGRSIMEAHGGRLWADARSGSGATFHVTIPFVP